MKIEIIPLALKKLKKRGIPIEWIEESLVAPDQVVSGYMERKVFLKDICSQEWKEVVKSRG